MSYQGSTLATIVTDRNTWQSRANSAWGSTRVWNSGTSFESAYNSEVTLYNNEVAAYNSMVTDRDTWQSRANSAWGSSRIWNSGESWEAAYNRVLPPVGDVVASGSVSLSGNIPGTAVNLTLALSSDPSVLLSGSGTVLTIGKTANYVFTASLSGSFGVSNGQVNLNLLLSGASQFTHTLEQVRGWATDVARRFGTLGAGSTIQLQVYGGGGNGSGVTGSWELIMLPNRTYPH